MGRHPPQAPRQGGDRRRPAQPAVQGHRQRVLARRRAVPRGALAARRHRAVRQGRARRLDGTPRLHAASAGRADRCCWSCISPCSAAWASRCGPIQMAWIPFWAAGVVNGLGHWWGYRNFESADTSTNLTPWGVWIGGEELHNNHHAFPSSARFSMRRWEVDIGWAVIKALEASAWPRCCAWRPRWTCAQHRRARWRYVEGAAVAPLPGHDRLPAQRAEAGAEGRGAPGRRKTAQAAAAPPAQGTGRRRPLAAAGGARAIAALGLATSPHPGAGRTPRAPPRCWKRAPRTPASACKQLQAWCQSKPSPAASARCRNTRRA